MLDAAAPPEDHDVVAAILLRGDQVLLCHRSPTRRWYPNVWDFPGGHVEEGESAVAALRREILEEIGIDVGAAPGEPFHHFSRPDIEPPTDGL